MEWYTEVLKKYAVFQGRARRQEFWMFFLFNSMFFLLAAVVDNIIGTRYQDMWYGIFYTLYSLAMLIPSLAVEIRRLHDVGKSGWWLFISLIPLIGAIWLFVLLVTDSQPGENQYGPNPKEVAEA
jgi:uncharacterized membrane protein YhaH (DUF805 family)